MFKLHKSALLTLLFLSSYGFAQLPGRGLSQITNEFNQIGGKITKAEAKVYIEKLTQEKILNAEGKQIFLDYVLEHKTPEIFEKIAKNDSVPNKAGQYLSLLKGVDTLFMNRASLLLLLGVIDLHKMAAEPVAAMGKPMSKMKPILGERWAFKPQIDGDPQNPLSFKMDMSLYRNDYQNLIDAVNRTGLLDVKVYNDTKKWLEKDERFLIKDFSVFLYAALRSVYYDSYEKLKTSQISKLDSLQQIGLLTNEAKTQLKNSLNSYQLLHKTDIFNELPNAIVFRATEVDFLQKKTILERLFKQLPQLLPELKISNVQISEIENNENLNTKNPLLSGFLGTVDKFMDRRKLEVAVNFNGKSYIKDIDFNQISEEAIPDTSMRNSLGRLLSSSWLGAKDLQIVNDYLNDIGSKKRLFVVGDEFSIFPSPSRDKKVVFLMDSLQHAKVQKLFISTALGFGSGQDFEGKNSLSSLKNIYQILLKNSVVEPLADTKVEELILKYRKSTSNRLLDKEIIYTLISQTPNRLVLGNLSEIEQNKNVFKAFVQKNADASFGAFKPENIEDNFEIELQKGKDEKKLLKFSFKQGDVVFADSMEVMPIDASNEFAQMLGMTAYSELDSKVIKLIKKACENSEYKPYSLSRDLNGTYYLLEKPS